MLFYDLDLGAWVRCPGSSSPAWMTPVLTIGSTFQIIVRFCRGEDIVDPGASAWLAGIRPSGVFSGDFIASDDAPQQDGSDGNIFILDLTTDAASAYFTENPSAEIQNASLQIKMTTGDGDMLTCPLEIVIQNSYLQTP